MAGMPTGSGGKLDWPGLVKESGLSVVSLHADLGSIEREPDAVAEDAHSFKTDRVVVTGMYRVDYGNAAAVREALLRGAQGELRPVITFEGNTHDGRPTESLTYGGTVTAEVRYSHV